MVMYDLIIQVACYAGVMLFAFLAVTFLLKGFLMKYIKVRASFGKFVLVKIRTLLRDYFAIGWVEDGFLVYKIPGGIKIRLAINPDDKVIYKALAVNWVDVDGEKNAILKTNYNAVTGFDSQKYENMYTRALTKPAIHSGQEKFVLIAVIVIGILVLIALYFIYKDHTLIQKLPAFIQSSLSGMKGTVVAGGGV